MALAWTRVEIWITIRKGMQSVGNAAGRLSVLLGCAEEWFSWAARACG